MGARREAGAFVEQVLDRTAGFDRQDIRYYVSDTPKTFRPTKMNNVMENLPSDNLPSVTEDMLRAGVAAFVEFDLRFDSLPDVLADVYRAMLAAGPQSP